MKYPTIETHASKTGVQRTSTDAPMIAEGIESVTGYPHGGIGTLRDPKFRVEAVPTALVS